MDMSEYILDDDELLASMQEELLQAQKRVQELKEMYGRRYSPRKRATPSSISSSSSSSQCEMLMSSSPTILVNQHECHYNLYHMNNNNNSNSNSMEKRASIQRTRSCGPSPSARRLPRALDFSSSSGKKLDVDSGPDGLLLAVDKFLASRTLL